MLPPFTCTVCNASGSRSTQLLRSFACPTIIICKSLVARGQTASLRGQVFDESGVVIPNAPFHNRALLLFDPVALIAVIARL